MAVGTTASNSAASLPPLSPRQAQNLQQVRWHAAMVQHAGPYLRQDRSSVSADMQEVVSCCTEAIKGWMPWCLQLRVYTQYTQEERIRCTPPCWLACVCTLVSVDPLQRCPRSAWCAQVHLLCPNPGILIYTTAVRSISMERSGCLHQGCRVMQPPSTAELLHSQY